MRRIAGPDVQALRRLGGAVAFCVALMGTDAVAQTRTLTPEALRAEASIALQAGRPEIAATYARALLARDADDVDALILLSRAARTLGRLDEARDSASRAWALADTPERRFAAAMVRAQALASSGQRTQAQLWLRRAAEIAPSARLKAVAVRDFRYVRARNPWGTELSFSVAPNSNINNGSRAETGTYEVPVFGTVDAALGGAAKALSGVEYTFGAQLRYRLQQSAVSRTDIAFGLSHRTYTLSEAAKEDAPDVEASDFAYSSVQGTLAHRGQLGDARRPYQISTTLGRTWYGGQPYMQYAVLGYRQTFVLGPGHRIDADISRRWQETLGTRTSDAEIWDLGAAWSQRLGSGHALKLGVALRDSTSDSANLDYRSTTLSADLTLARPVLGARIEMGLDLTVKHHDEGPVSGQDRTDHEAAARITAILSDYDYYGFVPTLSLTARRTESDYGQYDVNEMGLNIGLRSAF
ncbi:tetratricopeptide repeat protein [Aestuariicoccus sp. MJ-SS9]|uniref:tetratricopeptide repeat protein n=1 Tax=Aestuariicoccus sp. MJ-SS9 TaxID=3079855 RepID=UPI00290E6E3F|nr:tetratricopeptide repeat protein [Aestuariicoccus sp. MJ-SS9]MDU8912409.1 tetratricopeptide repeat protein [Aestuariicoccus sp. MJ-SS9]